MDDMVYSNWLKEERGKQTRLALADKRPENEK